jgi:trehalose 6-phosphate phosphatase
MKNVLSEANRAILTGFARSDVLLAFDYDGTLSPIVDEPDQAKMRPETRELLWRVSRLYPLIVITGRAQPDALMRLRGVGVREVIGNHGIEPSHASNRHVEEVQGWRPAIEACVASLEGVHLEDKIFTVALHYRQSPHKEHARATLLKMAAGLRNARIVGGKQVVNIVPNDAPHKGTALLRERERLHCDTAIYVGDDETDEDVFKLAQPEQLLTIRIGPSRTSAADYYIQSQQSVDELLALLVELRPEASRL